MKEREFFYNFGRFLYNIDAFYSEFARNSGVKPNLLWVLYALNDGNKHSQKEISASWDIPKTTVNTIVGELLKDEYISLSQIKGQKRELLISLTDKGKNYANKLLNKLYALEDKVYEELSNNARIVNENLEEILNSLKKEVKK